MSVSKPIPLPFSGRLTTNLDGGAAPVNSDNRLSTLATRLKRAREAAGLTVRDAGRLLGVSHGTVSNYEREGGTEKVPASYLVAVCEKLGVSPAWLLTGEGEMRPPPPSEKELRFDAIARIVSVGLDGASDLRDLLEALENTLPPEKEATDEPSSRRAEGGDVRGSR